MGDSICSFNPIYGQGMTVVAMEAQLLGKLLEEHLPRALATTAGAASGAETAILPTSARSGPGSGGRDNISTNTTSSMSCSEASACLKGLTGEFQIEAAEIVAGPWSLAIGADSAYDNSYGSEVVPGWMRWVQAEYNIALGG